MNRFGGLELPILGQINDVLAAALVFGNYVIPIATDEESVEVLGVLISTNQTIGVVIGTGHLSSLGTNNHIVKISRRVRPPDLPRLANRELHRGILDGGNSPTPIIGCPAAILFAVEIVEKENLGWVVASIRLGIGRPATRRQNSNNDQTQPPKSVSSLHG